MTIHVAASLLQLTKELNTRYAPPKWPTVSVGDGAVGDTSHAARKSDHNPDWDMNGVVRAIDISIEGRNKKEILSELIGDPRVWYVIHNGIIYSRTFGFKAKRYYGSNPHNHHIHVSIQGANGISRAAALKFERDTSPWFAKKRRTTTMVDFSNVKEQFLIAAGLATGKNRRAIPTAGVKVVQRFLNREVGSDLKIDGLVGESTLDAWAKFERRESGLGRPRIPDLSLLNKLLPNSIKIRE